MTELGNHHLVRTIGPDRIESLTQNQGFAIAFKRIEKKVASAALQRKNQKHGRQGWAGFFI